MVQLNDLANPRSQLMSSLVSANHSLLSPSRFPCGGSLLSTNRLFRAYSRTEGRWPVGMVNTKTAPALDTLRATRRRLKPILGVATLCHVHEPTITCLPNLW